MIVNSINLITYTPQTRKQPNFEGQPLNLNQVLKTRSKLLPARVLEEVKKVTTSKGGSTLTLKDIHSKVYAPLLECKNLEDAQKLFPEFSEVKEANTSFKRVTGNIKKLKENGYLKEGLSLKLLQDFWVKLKTQDEVAQELGLKNRSALGWILQKTNITNPSSNYRTLMMSTDPEINKVIASKTTAWNAAHPDLMRAHNKQAAQYMKKSEHREAHSQRMKKHFDEHPERREQISKTSSLYWSDINNRILQSKRGKNYALKHPEKAELSRIRSKAAWDSIPEVRQIMSNFFKEYVAEDKVLSARLRNVFSKRSKGQTLTDYDQMILKQFNKACFEAHPEIKTMLSEAYKVTQKDI